ncbi:3-hydroxybutyrate dehydrogenase type 2 [Chionoecetes opilio]|uniref:Dehydrogenase/reductase SDR family member 6 n=1 Tax=Chionoecetes opilio TaxID=41210 RepID=A0A8J5CMH4_CHIOP|nr:3-hydroxybutyrate dehydrogenase type 2 [Chionoecetes opilio]
MGCVLLVTGVERRVLDVRDAEGIKGLAGDHPDIDVLFNCAGDAAGDYDQEWDNSFDINVKSMFLFCKAFLPNMISRGGGSVINMSSVASSLRGIERRCAYGATKAAVIGLTKGVAMDHIRQGVRDKTKNLIHCSTLLQVQRCMSIPRGQPSFASRAADSEDSDLELASFMENKRIGRLAKPEEVANLCVYLASDENPLRMPLSSACLVSPQVPNH